MSCPICARLLEGQDRAQWPDFPFCSARCKLIDLGRWLGDSYSIVPEAGGEAPPEPDHDADIP